MCSLAKHLAYLKCIKIILLIISSIVISNAQTKFDSIFAHCYFPFDFVGFSFGNGNPISNGVFTKLGVEYRFNPDKGFFIRGNRDSRKNRYTVSSNSISNVVDGPIEFTDWTLGLGYRFKLNRFKPTVSLQPGWTNYTIPIVSGQSNQYVVDEISNSSPILKSTLSLEYYITKQAALTLDLSSFLMARGTPLWNDNLSIMTISLGLTTVLF